jgi:hypothetical protein
VLNANVFDDGSTDDRSVYTLVYSDETDRQENTTFDCSSTGENQGQSFTAGQTGVIQSIKVRAGAATNTDLRIRARGFDGDTATIGDYVQNVDLFFGQHSNSANLTVINLDEPFPVTEGQEYTFFFTGETTLSRSCAGSPSYPDGQPGVIFGNFNRVLTDQDFTFEVNIIGPTEAEFPSVGRTDLTVFAVDDQGNVSAGVPTSVNPDQALPVEWLYFGATAGAKQVDLQWETTEEPDNAGFHVERSAGGLRWEVISEVGARIGEDQHYGFTDQAPLSGDNFYRIRQTDFDGEVTYSSVEQVFFRAEDQILLYPNPTRQEVTLILPEGAALQGLYDLSGRRSSPVFTGGEGRWRADVSALPAGVYFLRVRLEDGRTVTDRLIVQQ